MSMNRKGAICAPRLSAIAAAIIATFSASASPLHAEILTERATANRAMGNQHANARARSASTPAPLLGALAQEWRRLSTPRPRDNFRRAGSIAVTNCADDGAGSLREALNNAVDDDLIDLSQLSCSSITLTSGALEADTDVTIRGPGRDQLTITAKQKSRVLTNNSTHLRLEDLTLADGMADAFGGCVFSYGAVSLTGARVTGCNAGAEDASFAAGGAILSTGDIALIDSLVDDNAAIGDSNVLGGGIFSYATVTLTNSVVSGSTATATATSFSYIDPTAGGGGIFAGNVVIEDGSRVTANTATADATAIRGGGVFAAGSISVTGGSVIADNVLRSENSSAYGGGLHANDQVTVASSRITGNLAHSGSYWTYGGGINVGDDFGDLGDGHLIIDNSTIAGNTNSADCSGCFIQGGGAHAFGQVRVEASTISGNRTTSRADSSGYAQGAGLASFSGYNSDEAHVINSTVSGNAVNGGADGAGNGGGIWTSRKKLTLIGTTVTANSASHRGGGVFADYFADAHALTSSIISGNTSLDDPEIGGRGGYYSTDVTLVGSHNIVTSAGTNITLPDDTLFVDAGLLPLADNGGANETHALAACSPAIDAGSNPENLDWDQRGAPFVRVYGSAADIGAFEWHPNNDVIFADGFESQTCPF